LARLAIQMHPPSFMIKVYWNVLITGSIPSQSGFFLGLIDRLYVLKWHGPYGFLCCDAAFAYE